MMDHHYFMIQFNSMIFCAEYKLLEELLQAQLLWLDGIFLMSRKTDRLHVELFALYNFYVEVFFDLKSDDPLYIKAFDQNNNLDPYMELINIDGAFERIEK